MTAGQAGADPAGTAASAVGTHESTYTHADIASNTADRHTIATVTGNGISLVGQEISLDIGTGATDVAAGNHLHTGVYDPAGSASAVAGDLTTHEGLTNGAHGISAYGATLVDDADQAAARSTLGLGDMAVYDMVDVNPNLMTSGTALANDVLTADGAGDIGWAQVSWDQINKSGAYLTDLDSSDTEDIKVPLSDQYGRDQLGVPALDITRENRIRPGRPGHP